LNIEGFYYFFQSINLRNHNIILYTYAGYWEFSRIQGVLYNLNRLGAYKNLYYNDFDITEKTHYFE